MQGCLLQETVLFCQYRKYELEGLEISIYLRYNEKLSGSRIFRRSVAATGCAGLFLCHNVLPGDNSDIAKQRYAGCPHPLLKEKRYDESLGTLNHQRRGGKERLFRKAHSVLEP